MLANNKIYTPCSKKGDTKLVAVSLLILYRFSICFHCQIFQLICNKALVNDSITPHMRRDTILWNANVRK